MTNGCNKKTGLERLLEEQTDFDRMMDRKQMIDNIILFGTFAIFVLFLRFTGI